MKQFSIYSLIAFFIVGCKSYTNPNECIVTFRVNTEDLSKDKQVFITGDNYMLGQWDPTIIELDRVNDHLFEYTIAFEKGINIEYRFTQGSWDSKAINIDKTTPSNRQLNVYKDTIVEHTIHRWENQ